MLTKKGGSKTEEVTERTVWSICFDCGRSCLEQGRSAGASIAMRVYHNAKLRMSMIRRPLGSSYRMSFVVKKGNAEKKYETTTRNVPRKAMYVCRIHNERAKSTRSRKRNAKATQSSKLLGGNGNASQRSKVLNTPPMPLENNKLRKGSSIQLKSEFADHSLRGHLPMSLAARGRGSG